MGFESGIHVLSIPRTTQRKNMCHRDRHRQTCQRMLATVGACDSHCGAAVVLGDLWEREGAAGTRLVSPGCQGLICHGHGGPPKTDGLFHGKSESKMDENWG